jgi:putative transcriptional regulator
VIRLIVSSVLKEELTSLYRTTRLTRTDTYIAFIMDHVAGNHPESFAIAADLHISLSPNGAETGDLWAMIGGVLLEESLSAPSRPSGGHRRQPTPSSNVSIGEILSRSGNQLRWRRGLSGVHYAPAGTPGTKFMKLDPGRSAPMHGHGGLEATVVLSGRFTDGHGTYARGDLVLGEPGLRHKPAAIGDESCVCFVAHRPSRFWRYFQ